MKRYGIVLILLLMGWRLFSLGIGASFGNGIESGFYFTRGFSDTEKWRFDLVLDSNVGRQGKTDHRHTLGFGYTTRDYAGEMDDLDEEEYRVYTYMYQLLYPAVDIRKHRFSTGPIVVAEYLESVPETDYVNDSYSSHDRCESWLFGVGLGITFSYLHRYSDSMSTFADLMFYGTMAQGRRKIEFIGTDRTQYETTGLFATSSMWMVKVGVLFTVFE